MDVLEKGYWIMPMVVLEDKELSANQKLLYCLISSLCAEKWYCWATNKYLWERLGLKEWSISNAIKGLVEKWYLNSDVNLSKGSERHITIGYCENSIEGYVKNQKGVCENSQGGYVKNQIHNNINNNSIIEYNKNNITPLLEKEEYSFVEEFLDRNNPITAYCFKKYPNYLETQMVAVDKLVKQGYPIDVIKLALMYIKQDKFWSKNILSVKKLLEKNKDGIPYIVTIIQQMKDYKPVVAEL